MKHFIKILAIQIGINSVFVAADEVVRQYIKGKFRKTHSTEKL